MEEFELSLTQGAWDQDRWGAAAFPAAAGAELKAWFSSPPDGGDVDERFVKSPVRQKVPSLAGVASPVTRMRHA